MTGIAGIIEAIYCPGRIAGMTAVCILGAVNAHQGDALPEDIEDTPEHRNDPPDTPLGMLQRGRGAGYLWALQQDPHTLHPLLVECITHDSRLDYQIEQRAYYYARLARASHMDVAPLADYLRTTTHARLGHEVTLTIETLGWMAEMGSAEATSSLVDYASYGAQWDYALQQLIELPEVEDAEALAQAVCERFKSGEDMDNAAAYTLLGPYGLGPLWEKWAPRYPCVARLVEELHLIEEERERGRPARPDFTNLPLSALLEQVDVNSRNAALQSAISKVRPEDKEVCIRAFETSNPFAWRVAFECLSVLDMAELVYDTALMKSVELLPLLEALGERHALQVQKRIAIKAIMRSLPPEMTLPYARLWFDSPNWHLAMVADDLLEKHATIQDFPMVQAALAQRLQAGPDELETYGTSSLLVILSRFADIGPVPEVERTFIETGYSYGRMHAAKAMCVNAPEWFARGYAFECLWDCEEETRVIGRESVALDVPGAKDRLRALADDPLEDESVRDAARARVPGA